MGRAAKDRLLDLELQKTDFAEIAPQDARHAAERGVRVSLSKPDESIALVFVGGTRDKTTTPLRQAVSLSIDRAAIANFILQKTGEPASGLLPQWLSGTEFLFAQQPSSTTTGAVRAKELLSQIAAKPKLVLGYDAADPLSQAIAERIAVNAKEAGVTITTQALPAGAAVRASALSQSPVDAMIQRSRLASKTPSVDENFAGAERLAGIEHRRTRPIPRRKMCWIASARCWPRIASCRSSGCLRYTGLARACATGPRRSPERHGPSRTYGSITRQRPEERSTERPAVTRHRVARAATIKTFRREQARRVRRHPRRSRI